MVVEDGDRHVVSWRLASGTELLGEYQSSGVHRGQYLLRRHDGQLIQVPPCCTPLPHASMMTATWTAWPCEPAAFSPGSSAPRTSPT